MKITSEYCRVCLKDSSVFNAKTSSFESFSIYKKDEENQSFADKLQHLTKFEIPRNVPLAKRICKACSIKLNSAFTLIKQCQENERIIQNYLRETNLNKKCNNSTPESSKITNYFFQEQFKDSIKSSDEVKISMKVEAVLDTNSDFFDSDNEDNFKNEVEDVSDSEEEKENNEKTAAIEITPIENNKCDSDIDDQDFDDVKDKDFTVDDVGESASDTDGSDSDYSPKSKKPNLKMVSFTKAKKMSLEQYSNSGARPIKLNLIRGTKIKTANNNNGSARSDKIETESTEENDHMTNETKPNPKISIKTNLSRNRNLIKLMPYRRLTDSKSNANVNLKSGKRKIFLKPRKLADCKSTVCPICGKTYQSGDTMRGHIKWHENNEECFKCEICGKGFDNPSYLKCHKKIHSKRPTPYTCEICGKAFFHPNKLRLHSQYAHTNQRLKCPHCDVTVKYPSSLKRHLNTHTEVKNYECIDCSKTFRSRSNLTQHLESKFHFTKEIQPMIRIHGIAQQYIAGPPKLACTKKKRNQVKKGRTLGNEFETTQDQTVESIESSHISYEEYENEAQIAGNYLVSSFTEFPENKAEQN